MKNVMDNRTVIIERAKYDVLIENADIHKGKAVYCITTAAFFRSAKEAAEFYGISYGSLIQCLNRNSHTCGSGKGNRNKGLQFCYVAEAPSALPAISRQQIEMKQHSVSKEDVAKLKKDNEDLREEIQNKDDTIKTLNFMIQNYKAKLDIISSALAG